MFAGVAGEQDQAALPFDGGNLRKGGEANGSQCNGDSIEGGGKNNGTFCDL